MIKKILTNNIEISDEDIRLIDIRASSDILDIAQVRIADYNNTFNAMFQEGKEIKIMAGFVSDAGAELTKEIFNGYISKKEGDQLIVLKLTGTGLGLKKKKMKISYNQITPYKILNDICLESGLNFEIENITDKKRHTYILPNDTLLEAINRVNNDFELNLNSFIDISGKLLLKKYENQINNTNIEFKDGQYKKFNNNLLKTFIDLEVNVFDKIKILDEYYIVTGNRLIMESDKNESIITVAAA